jgi:hypothetical protein
LTDYKTFCSIFFRLEKDKSMSLETDDTQREPYFIFTDEDEDRLITDALEADLSNPALLRAAPVRVVVTHVHGLSVAA